MKTPSTLAPIDPLRRYSINEAALLLSVSRSHLYVLMDRGEIQTIRDGKRRFVPAAEIARHSTLPAAL